MKTPYEMQIELSNAGYDNEYLETLGNDKIKSMYIDEFGEEELEKEEEISR